ncbi:hypothetical protein [Streptomyces sp. NBC_01408]|uniref:hypothetical protein n=1 Tax=Streptomyces sp. NBC_01408 TaxID=2903855 RepID=UPI0022560543|nr:hypothetical protein [Streptomyces sp. NBC_01408]MCX4696998.1 hypothetical protein [Streptomyces sp. NBC_01408]
MVIAFLVFMALGAVVVVTPGAALGYAFVVTSGRLSLGARVPLLLVLAAASAVAWMGVAGAAGNWRPAIMVLSFTATLVSGATFLVHESRQRRAPRFPTVVWPGWHPPADPR